VLFRSTLFQTCGLPISNLARALSNELGWDYVEITPGRFLDEGDQNIIKNINIIFEKLYQLKNTVIFFDEVDQLVKTRKSDSESGDIWVVTALLPKLQELHSNHNIKFVLATNHIDRVDSAIKRPGRIDLVIPMGGICWPDRLRFLIKQIESKDNGNAIKDIKNELFGQNLSKIKLLLNKHGELRNLEDQAIWDKKEHDLLKKIKGKIINPSLVQLLTNTNNMPYENIKYIFQELVEECSVENYKNKSYIYKKYVVPNPVRKGGEIEKFDDLFRKEVPKSGDPLPIIPYSAIMRMPNKVEILVQDDDNKRFEYIKKHVLDFCTF
jgi:SpoVK/Ycf46/Vps4 family AAA+-type ATPase